MISQILVPSQAVHKGEAVSDLDVDLVVAEAPDVVVDRPVHVLLHIALNLAALRTWNLRLLLLQGGRTPWKRLLTMAGFGFVFVRLDLDFDMGSMVIPKSSHPLKANAEIVPCWKTLLRTMQMGKIKKQILDPNNCITR